jgi:hypothetical protein
VAHILQEGIQFWNAVLPNTLCLNNQTTVNKHRCLFASVSSEFNNVPTLWLIARHDTFVLGKLLGIQELYESGENILSKINLNTASAMAALISGATRVTIENAMINPKRRSFFSPTCIYHQFIEFASYSFVHLSTEPYSTLEIDGTSLRNAISQWRDRVNLNPDTFISLYEPNCTVGVCNPTCPTFITGPTESPADHITIFIPLIIASILSTIIFVLWTLTDGYYTNVWRQVRIEAKRTEDDNKLNTSSSSVDAVEMKHQISPVTLSVRDLFYRYPVMSCNTFLSKFSRKFQPDKKTVLSNVNFTIPPGSLTFVMGPSGSGKSTLLEALCNRRTLGDWEGTILINNAKCGAKFWKENVAFVPQFAQMPSISFFLPTQPSYHRIYDLCTVFGVFSVCETSNNDQH